MRDEFCKCHFCTHYDEYEGCEWGCDNYDDFKPDKNKLIKKTKSYDISVSDLIALINLG